MFRELFDSAPDAMVAVDRGGRIVRANAQATSLFGYAPEELTGVAIESLVPRHARAAHVGHRDGFIANPRNRPMGVGQQLYAVKRNGDEFPVEIALSPINTPDGQTFIASIRDVSETHRARQALLRARYDAFVAQAGRLTQAAPNLDALFEHLPELVVDALHIAGAAIVCRHGVQQVWSVRAAFGLPPDLVAALADAAASAGGIGEPRSKVDAVSAGDGGFGPGTVGTAELAAAGFGNAASIPLLDGDETVGRLVALAREPRPFDHDALNFLGLVANQIGAALLRIRMEEQLSHAQRLEAVGQLTGGIAHDFNNLLTIISGNLEILQDGSLSDGEARELIGNALRAVGRGADLTRKLLAFARRQRLSPAATSPRRLLEEIGAMLRRTLGETVELEIACAADIPAVYADPGQLEGALVNLALNSRDAMPRGGRLTIAAAQARQRSDDSVNVPLVAGNYVVFAIRDTGLGMAPEVLARAFEPFFTTKEPGRGTGLGLSMVYGFVKQSGGHINVDSRLGYGTSIELYLPVAEQQETAPPDATTTAPTHGRQTILVVEDEADVREIATAFLRSNGYAVVAEGSAEAAVSTIASERAIAMAFLDVVLGSGMNGIDLAHEIRRRRPGLPIVLTSGYDGSRDDGGSDAGAGFDLLRKPYLRQELLAAVRRALDGG